MKVTAINVHTGVEGLTSEERKRFDEIIKDPQAVEIQRSICIFQIAQGDAVANALDTSLPRDLIVSVLMDLVMAIKMDNVSSTNIREVTARQETFLKALPPRVMN